MDWEDLTAQETRGGRVITGVRLGEVTTFRQLRSRPSHPDSPALDHHGSHGRDQTSGSLLAPEASVRTRGDGEGKTVGDHDQA